MKKIVVTLFLAFLFLAGCSPLVLKPGYFGWSVESPVKVDHQGMIEVKRYDFSVNVKNLLFAETQDSINVSKVTLRLIRDEKGYFFMTAANFKNVYVFEQTEGGLKLANKILVSEKGLSDPAFNQRKSHIELINENDPPVKLTKDGIVEGGKK